MSYTPRILALITTILYSSVFATEEPLIPNNVIQKTLAPYSSIEKIYIEKDRKNISDLCFSQATKEQKRLIYIATAGGPGTSKSTILEAYLHNHPGFVYADPDQRALKFMINTYLQKLNNYSISKASSYHNLLIEAYTKWRGASNYIAYTILNEAYAKELAIAHGTTSTSKSVTDLYKKLKGKGYKIILLLCNSSEENRLKATENRENNQALVQSNYSDFIQKGEMFYENFPVYFEFADEIQFFWIEDFSKGWTKVGDYSRSAGFKPKENFKKFEDYYEAFRIQHPDKKLPTLGDLIKKQSDLNTAHVN